jgi:large subunit ribosomal protein L31
MKKDIQPKVYTDCVVTCACGGSFVTTSTQKAITVDICSSCHPFFTGQQKFVDTEGRIDKFEKKAKLMEQRKEQAEAIKKAKTERTKKPEATDKKQSLKELFTNTQN